MSSETRKLYESESLYEIKEKLDELNFKKMYGNESLINLEGLYRPQKGGYHHQYGNSVCKCCKSCENMCKTGYHLGIVSHGTHITDYLDFVGYSDDVSQWNSKDGVMFVLEAPGKNKCYLNPDRSSKIWWHLDEFNNEKMLGETDFQNFERMKTYGPFLFSVAMEYKLANYYITNIVKCEFENDYDDSAAKWDDITDEAKMMCSGTYLFEEIRIVKPKVIFASGDVYNYIQYNKKFSSMISDLYDGKGPQIVKLPHPAAIITNDFRQIINIGIITKELMKCGIISKEVARQKLYSWLEM